MNLQEEARQFLADYEKLCVLFNFNNTEGTVVARSQCGLSHIVDAALKELASAYRLHLAVIKELEERKEASRQLFKPNNKNLRGKILDAQDKLQEAVKLINKADSKFDDLRVSMGHKNKNWQYRIFKAQGEMQDVLKLINEVGCGLEDLRIDAELINNA